MSRLRNQLKSVGELDELIGITSESGYSVDDYGAIVPPGFSATPNIRAKVRFDRTNEDEQAKQEKFTQEIKVWMRYSSTIEQNAGTGARTIVYWNSKYWDVYAMEHTPGRRFHVLKCRLIEQ